MHELDDPHTAQNLLQELGSLSVQVIDFFRKCEEMLHDVSLRWHHDKRKPIPGRAE